MPTFSMVYLRSQMVCESFPSLHTPVSAAFACPSHSESWFSSGLLAIMPSLQVVKPSATRDCSVFPVNILSKVDHAILSSLVSLVFYRETDFLPHQLLPKNRKCPGLNRCIFTIQLCCSQLAGKISSSNVAKVDLSLRSRPTTRLPLGDSAP